MNADRSGKRQPAVRPSRVSSGFVDLLDRYGASPRLLRELREVAVHPPTSDDGTSTASVGAGLLPLVTAGPVGTGVSQSIQKWIEDKLRSGEGLLITSSSIRGGFDVAKKSSGEAAYSEGDDVGREPAEAPTDAQQAALEERAERGDREAMYDLALGMRAQLRLAEAERWWSAAANAGHSRAMRDLAGRLSDRGQYEQAAKWFQAAIAAGDSEAMYRLAEMLHGSRQPREAERWFRAAAEAGDQRAINWLRSQRNTQETFFQAFKNVVLDGNLSAASELARQLVVSGQHKRVEQWLAEDASRENPANARAALEILDRVRQEEDERDHARRANWMS